MAKQVVTCLCMAFVFSAPASARSTLAHTQVTMKDYGKGTSCLHQVLVVEGLNLTKAEYNCLCFDQCTPLTSWTTEPASSYLTQTGRTSNMGTTPATTEMWFGTGYACITRVFKVYKLNMTQEEAMCKCYGGDFCLGPAGPTQAASSFLPSSSSSAGGKKDYGEGFECLNQALVVEGLNLTKAEYTCLCFGECTEDDVKDLEKDIVNLGLDKRQEYNRVSIGFRTTFLTLILIAGIFGNVLVIVTVLAFMGKTTVTNMYICSLAVADLLVVLVCVPFKMVETTHSRWEGGDVACKMVMWLYFGSFMCSVFTLATMSIERFLVICYPVFSHVISSTRRTAVIIAVTWITAAALSAPAFYVIKTNMVIPNVEIYTCLPDLAEDGHQKRMGFFIYVYLVIFLIPISLMSFSYIRTSITLWKSIKKQRELKNLHTKKSSSRDKDKKQKKASSYGRVQVIRLLITLLVVFVLCWFPYLTTQLFLYTVSTSSSEYNLNSAASHVSKWFNLLSLLNSCLNPILYGFLSRRFREGFKRCLKCDRKSVNSKRGSVITATSSINGSIQKHGSHKNHSRNTSLKMETVSESEFEIAGSNYRKQSETSVISEDLESSVVYEQTDTKQIETNTVTDSLNPHSRTENGVINRAYEKDMNSGQNEDFPSESLPSAGTQNNEAIGQLKDLHENTTVLGCETIENRKTPEKNMLPEPSLSSQKDDGSSARAFSEEVLRCLNETVIKEQNESKA